MLLGWSQADLGKAADVGEVTVPRLEARDGDLGGRPETGKKIIRLKRAAAQKSTGLLPQRTHCYVGRPVDLLARRLGLASRRAGLWVVRASIPAPPTNGAQTMSTLSIKSRNTKSAAPKKGSAQSKTASRRKVTSPAAPAKKPTRSVESKAERVAAAKTLRKADEPRAEGVTKQERVLTLLSQSEGASIEEMMQATDWQQHSVRGFLAGMVKKKLGFSLTSLKSNGGVRRYRIETRRAR